MKKFLVYLCIIIVAVSTGFAIFYLVKDNEVISLGTTSLYKDVGSTFELSLNVSKPNSYTKITLSSSNEDVLEITNTEINLKENIAKGSFTAKVGGVSRVNFQTTNSKFRNLYCDVVIGDGTVNYPFYISSAQQLSQIGKKLYDENEQEIINPYTMSSSYELVSDIDLSTLDEDWMPLGFEGDIPFTGTFNGNGYTISNLKIKNANSQNIGLFHTVANGAKVENVKFVNAEVNTTSYTKYAGVVAGVNMGTIQAIEVKNAVLNSNFTSATIGGIVGFNKSINTTSEKFVARVDRCSANVTFNGIPASYDEEGQIIEHATTIKGNVGGLVGHNLGGIVINCYTLGEYIAGANAQFGGLIYKNEYLPITGVAGLYTEDLGANVKDCYSIINIKNTDDGLYEYAAVIYNNIDRTEPINQVMGLYYETEKSAGHSGVSGMADQQYFVEGKTTAELKTVNLPSHLTYEYQVQDGQTVKVPNGVAYWSTQAWYIDGSNNGYPVLNYNAKNVSDDFNDAVDDEDVNQVEDKESLLQILQNGLDQAHVITADIDLSNEEWVPVGTVEAPFTGSLKVAINAETNKPFVIKGLKVTQTNYDYAGFFGVISGAVIENLVLDSATIYNNHGYVGAIVGANGIEGKLVGGTISNCQVNGAILKGNVAVGAVAGTNSGTINNATVTSQGSAISSTNITVSPVKEGYAGGIAGLNYATITVINKDENYNVVKGNVKICSDSESVISFIGGGVAGLNNGEISNVFVSINNSNDNSIYGVIADDKYTAYAGGVAGYGKGIINNAMVSARVIASENTESYVAGVVGYLNTGNNVAQENVKNAYVYGSYIKGAYAGGLVGYLAGSDNVAILYHELDFFSQLYSEKIVIDDEYYKQNNLVANITSSAVEESVSIYGKYSGGLVCELQRGFVTDCYSHAVLSAENNAGFVYNIMYNKVNSTGGVITRCYVVANFDGGKNNHYVTNSIIHSSNDINKRTAGFIDDYYYASNKGSGKSPVYFAGAVSDVVNWFKSDENHDVTKKRELDTLRKSKVWSSFTTKNITTGLSPWNVSEGKLPILDINKTYELLKETF